MTNQSHFQVHLITDRGAVRADVVSTTAAALQGGIDWVQVRDKTGSARDLYDTVRAVQPYAVAAGAGVLVNDRVDVALATGAGGVHLAQQSLPPCMARRLIGDRLLGASVHSLEEARAAVAGGVDYVTFGHVYQTASKPGLAPRGIDELANIIEAVPVPVLAIGGINVANVAAVLRTGVAGIAVIAAILAASDPLRAASELRQTVDAIAAQPRYPFPQRREERTR